jgi:glycerophosphoryl diester phosphodiesterase
MVIGHRGYVKPDQSRLLENTLLAFEQAWKNGAEGVEFDVHLSKDDHLICYHDFTLKKLGIDKKIGTLTLNDIKRVEMPERQTIPTFKEIIDHFGEKMYFNVEIKAPEAVYSVMDLIEEKHLKEKCLISSFHPAALEVIKGANRGFHAALLYLNPIGKIERAKALKVNTLHPFFGHLPFKLATLTRIFQNHHLSLALNYGYTINVWTVNNEKTALTLAKKGVTGIITDNVPLLSQTFT